MKLTININKGHYNLTSLRLWLSAQKDGEVLLEAKRINSRRSSNQNAYLWGVVYPAVADGLADIGWEEFSVEDVHEYCKSMFLGRDLFNCNTGERITLPSSTAICDTAEFSTYVEKIGRWAAEYLGIVIPDPHD